MKWTIAFDSGCDIREPEALPGIALELVPLKIVVGSREVTDDGSVSMEKLQNMLDHEKGKTGTACPSAGQWHSAMEGGENVIAITISGAVSGSYQSACAARDMILEEEPDRNIFVMDSVSGSGTMEFLVRRAVELIRAGESFEGVCRGLQALRENSQIFFLLQNVSNIMSNGRLNPIIGKAVKALKFSLLATVSPEGTLGVIGKVRGFEKAMERSLDECAKKNYVPRRVLITHCLNSEGAELMREKLLSRFPWAQVEIRGTGLLCGYYAEKGGLIVAMES